MLRSQIKVSPAVCASLLALFTGALLVSQSWIAMLSTDFAETVVSLLLGTGLMAGGVLAYASRLARAGFHKKS